MKQFGNDVIIKSKRNLASNNVGGSISSSIGSKSYIESNGVSVVFTLPDYWEYVDYGVTGVGGSRADGSSWVKKRVTNSKFKYNTAKPPASAFSKYTSDRSSQFAMATSVFHTGIKTTGFFTNPFDKELSTLGEDISNALLEGVSKDLDIKLSGFNNLTII
tara:strand:+ start:45 stop:527 length:483 start_codon:yes stop_codon:yes gene_type:complete